MKFANHEGKPLDLVLYKYDTCPFCIKVRWGLRRLGLQVPMRDTRREEGVYQELMQLGGSTQVPALSVNGEVMYESSEILSFLQKEVVAVAETVEG